MKRFVLLVGMASIFLASAPSYSPAQQYYYPPNMPAYRVPQRVPQRPQARNPYYYYMVPAPEVMRKWDVHNRWQDFQHYQRSPLNPESTLDYMLRTF